MERRVKLPLNEALEHGAFYQVLVFLKYFALVFFLSHDAGADSHGRTNNSCYSKNFDIELLM